MNARINIETEVLRVLKDVGGKQDPGKYFSELCRSVFGSQEGQALLEILTIALPPISRGFISDPRLAAYMDGGKDFCAMLWRYGTETQQPAQQWQDHPTNQS